MGTNTRLTALGSKGIEPSTASFLSTGLERAATGLTATGSDAAGALLVTKPISVLGTTAASTGIRLGENLRGELVIVKNSGASTLTIYPPTTVTSSTINGSASVTLATTKTALLFAVSSTAWHSVGLD